MTLTPEKLRAYHAQAEVAPFAPIEARDCELLALAVEYADGAAWSDIEWCCALFEKVPGGPCWFDSSDLGDNWHDTSRIVFDALRYLELRGLLIRKDGAPHVVSFRSPE